MSGVVPAALRSLLYGVRDVFVDGVQQVQRPGINFSNGVTATDNPVKNRLDISLVGPGLTFLEKLSGETLAADSLNELLDDEQTSPTFVLPAPATWKGRRLVAKRLNQAAAEVTITVSGGALIDGAASYTLVGEDACAEFYSDGTRVLVGPTTTFLSAAWTPASIVGAYFWAKGISDPSLRTMSGSNVVAMANGIDNGLVLTGSGSPAINSTNLLNGYPSLVLGASSELISLSGGPVGNAAHWCIVLTDGDAPTTEALARNGAKNAASPVGFLGNPFFAAALPADFLPYADGASTPIPDGTPRVVGGHHLPSYGHKIVRVDGYTPQPGAGSNWTQAKTFSLTSEFGFGRAVTANSANASRIRDAVWGTGEISAGDYGRLLAYWKARFSLGALAPRILFLGDSLTDPGPISPATTNWPALMTTTLNAQLTIDARTNVVTSNTALSGKMLNGLVWAAGNPAVTFQADGQYQSYVTAGVQGIHYSAPYSRSGRRKYDIAAGIAGTNDLINAGRTEAQVIADLTYVFTKLRDAGYYRVWGTIPRGSNAGGYFDGVREPRRVAINTWLTTTALTSGLIDEVVDFDAAGLVWNTTYYGTGPDTLHQNDAGKTLMAAAMYEATYRLIRRIDP